ncbi:hypothetical protein O9929_09605 [Vibrio lentus]|nr:hypothetical protein [Vibrio lentus]
MSSRVIRPTTPVPLTSAGCRSVLQEDDELQGLVRHCFLQALLCGAYQEKLPYLQLRFRWFTSDSTRFDFRKKLLFRKRKVISLSMIASRTPASGAGT